MTKLIVTLALVLVPSLFFAQTAFDKFDGQENVTSVIVNKKTFEMLGGIKGKIEDKEVSKFVDLANNIEGLKMYTTSSNKVGADMKATFESYCKKEALEPLVRVNDKGKNIGVYIKSGNKTSKIKEVLVFIEGGDKKGDETMILALKGDFDLDSLAELQASSK